MTSLPLLMALLACDGSTTDPTDSGTEPGTTDSGTPSDSDPTGTCEPDEWWPDGDGDGYGDDAASAVEDCDPPGDNWVRNGRDCDDRDDGVYPGATDICDGTDGDCDGAVDEDGEGEFLLYPDDDGDGYGDESAPVDSCTEDLPGYSERGGDCDDDEPAVNPGETEICNDGLDNDCDGSSKPCGLGGSAALDDADGLYFGSYKEAGFGANGAGVGDLDGDGVDDVVIGSGFAGFWADAATGLPFYVGYGQAGSAPSLTEIANDTTGVAAVDAAGLDDLDSNGNRELLVGAAPGVDSGNSGAAYLFGIPPKAGASLDVNGIQIRGSSTDLGTTGTFVGQVGDLDGDGALDFAVAAPLEYDLVAYSIDGRVGIYTALPTNTGFLDDADILLTGTGDQWLGFGLDQIGDTDGDGFDDLVLGGPGTSTSAAYYVGAGYVYLGPIPGSLTSDDADRRLDGDGDYGYFAASVSAAGDTNGDGYQDFWLGSFGSSGSLQSDNGHARLFLGPVDPSADLEDAHAVIEGGQSGDQLAWTLDGSADFNGDGNNDLIVGAMGAQPPGSGGSGAAYLFYGPLSGTASADEAAWLVSAGAQDEGLGMLAVSAGDLNGDGLDDPLIGAPGTTRSGAQTGALGLFWGEGL